MKSKKKFDPQVLQQFFIDHAEKFVVGLVAVVFLFFTYQAVTLKGYATKPDELQTRTKDASDKIAAGPATKTAATVCAFPPYPDIIDGARTTIDPGAYPMTLAFDWTPVAPRRVRDTPEIYAVERLRAIPGRGACLQGNAGTVGQRWVAVTGLVPYKKELDEYRKFEGAAQVTDHDLPEYVGFLVQRAEVAPGSKGEPNWPKRLTVCPSRMIEAKFANWSGTAAEVVDPRVTFEALTSRLPPLADGVWGEEVAYPPQIKLLPPDAKPEEAGQPGGGMIQPPRGSIRDGRSQRPRGGGPLGTGDRNNPKGQDDANAADILGGPDAAPKPAATKNKDEEDQAQVPEYLLLRYFDFDVKPDKRYAYRIFLLLRNPNYGLDANVLEEAELAKFPILGPIPGTERKDEKGNIIWVDTDPIYAPWSKPCTSALGPDDMRLLGGPVVAAKGPQEINGEVRILLWLDKNGLNSTCVKPSLVRGTVLNFENVQMRTHSAEKTPLKLLSTNCILVDLTAGGEATRDSEHDNRLTGPGMILVLDDSGNLVIHDQVAESQEWEKANKEPPKHQVRVGTGGRDRPRVPPRRPKEGDYDDLRQDMKKSGR